MAARKPIAKSGGRRKNNHVDQLSMFMPDAEWTPPEFWPDLSRADYIGFDTETFDPHLKEKGPGFIRGDAELIGISLATGDGPKLYLPIGHVEGNVDRDKALRYVAEQLGRPNQRKCGANLHYDLEALWSEGISVKGPLCDIQVAEPILDEDKDGGYSLETLSHSYLGYGKNETLLREAGLALGLDPKTNMKYFHSKYCGPYAEDDAENSILVFLEQMEALKCDDCWNIFKLESELQPILFKMRLHGVKVDLEGAERLAKEVKKKVEGIELQIKQLAGRFINFNSSTDVGEFLTRVYSVDVPRTAPTDKAPDGNLSITAPWLSLQTDEGSKLIKEARTADKMRKDFLEGVVLGRSVNGRLHPRWHQLRKNKGEEEGDTETQGTRTGRISASDPNLTQIPSRDPYWGPAIRSLFLPDDGGFWCKNDYSQQEPRIMLDFAFQLSLAGSAEAMQKFKTDKNTDYHQMTADLIYDVTGNPKFKGKPGRKPSKEINLGAAYGMGKDKIMRRLNLPMGEAAEILKLYHEGVPYVKLLEQACMADVEQFGYIITVLGRKRRFNSYEKRGAWMDRRNYNFVTKDREEAVRLWGSDFVRAHCHKALNAKVQGSAADQIKKTIIMLDHFGLTPQIQVYDELNRTCYSKIEPLKIQMIMESALEGELSIPFEASPDIGPSWGQVEPMVH